MRPAKHEHNSNMKQYASRFNLGLLAALLMVLWPSNTRAEYADFYSSHTINGSDIVIKELRWPYWNGGYYNTWFSDYWTSSEGVSGYFYNGLALPPANSPNPVTSPAGINWSFWGLTDPINISDTVTSVFASPTTFSMPTTAEGTIFRSPGRWAGWRTNVWYRMVERTWRPVDGTPHQGFAGTWYRDGYSGVWHHMATVQLPFAVTGVSGASGFQEDAVGEPHPQGRITGIVIFIAREFGARPTNFKPITMAGRLKTPG
jgi:hypothetical protein